MHDNQAKNLFQMQTELVDLKVDMAVGKAIDKVVDQIISLRHEMHVQINDLRNEMHVQINGLRNEMYVQINGLRNEMHEFRDEVNKRFSSLENRVTTIETTLGISSHTKQQVRSKLIDYGFRAMWAMLSVAFALLILQLQILIK